MSRAEQASIEAAEWLVAQADGQLTPEDRALFDAWFNASEGNKAAYWRLELGWEEADRVTALGHGPGEVIRERRRARTLRWWLPASIAASVALAIVVQQLPDESTAFPPMQSDVSERLAARSYSTAVGERHLVGLPDGSRVQLNTRSKLRTEITAQRREVWLDEGEAFFEVAHREDRPFVVHAGSRRITVLGTKFSVRREGEKVVVAVLDGRVELAEVHNSRPVRSSIIVGGDIATATAAATLVTSHSGEGVEQALSWRDGMLSFDQKPLAAIAAEFNRYNVKKLVLDEQSVGPIRITGTFPADKPDAFARLLREAYGLQVDDTGHEIRIAR